MIRFKPAKEGTLIPAPGWEEAEGRPVQRGEIGIAEVEVRFLGRRNEGPREIEEIRDEVAIDDADEERT